jgi:hypothetical protein
MPPPSHQGHDAPARRNGQAAGGRTVAADLQAGTSSGAADLRIE